MMPPVLPNCQFQHMEPSCKLFRMRRQVGDPKGSATSEERPLVGPRPERIAEPPHGTSSNQTPKTLIEMNTGAAAESVRKAHAIGVIFIEINLQSTCDWSHPHRDLADSQGHSFGKSGINMCLIIFSSGLVHRLRKFKHVLGLAPASVRDLVHRV